MAKATWTWSMLWPWRIRKPSLCYKQVISLKVNIMCTCELASDVLGEGASFNNWLDAVDGSFCTFENGDDPRFVRMYRRLCSSPSQHVYVGWYISWSSSWRLEGSVSAHFSLLRQLILSAAPESCGIIAPPFVVSVSYGSDEASMTAAYAQRQCTEYAKLGMMGTTVLYSSGDDGVAGNDGICLNARGRNVYFHMLSILLMLHSPSGQPSRTGTAFSPGFPVTCPFLTAVGATQVNPGSTVNDPESACEQVIFSGGGFSNIFEMPDYQAAAVTAFLQDHPPPFTSAQFNNSGKVCKRLGSRKQVTIIDWLE